MVIRFRVLRFFKRMFLLVVGLVRASALRAYEEWPIPGGLSNFNDFNGLEAGSGGSLSVKARVFFSSEECSVYLEPAT